jgi:hypothetical protein
MVIATAADPATVARSAWIRHLRAVDFSAYSDMWTRSILVKAGRRSESGGDVGGRRSVAKTLSFDAL